MALTGSQLATFTQGTATTAVSPSVSPAANSIVFVTLTFQGASLPAISGISGLGLTWAAGATASAFDGSFSTLATWWAATGGSAPTPGTITVTFSVSSTFDGMVDQVTGGCSALVGGASSVNNSASSGTTASVSSPAPQSSANFLYGATACAGVETLTANGALANIGSQTGGNEGVESQGATGITTSGVKCSATLSASDGWGAVCVEVIAAAPSGAMGAARPGQTWLRRFHHRQILPSPASVVAAVVAGPPVYPLGHPVQAKVLPARGGSTSSRTGPYGRTGPPVKPATGPVQARVPQQVRGGTVTRRTGAYGQLGPAVKALASAVAGKLRGFPPRGRTTTRAGAYGQLGPPVKAASGPVEARRQPQRGGSTSSRTGAFGRTGPPVKPAAGPVQARQPLPPRGGRTTSRSGTYTFVGISAGPPVYPLGHPVQARRQPLTGGRVIRRAGVYAGTGPAVKPLPGPVQARQPLPPRGRTAALRGPYGQTGPPVIPLRRPARGQPQRPLLTGRAAWRTGPAAPPPAFTIGALTATDKGTSTLTATGAASALTASTAPSGALTARDQRTGGPS